MTKFYTENDGEPMTFLSPILRGGFKVMEEAGELTQVMAKAAMVNGDIKAHWDVDLENRIIEELADNLAATAWFCEANLSDKQRERVDSRVRAKMKIFDNWAGEA